jgi:hypothetical protein
VVVLALVTVVATRPSDRTASPHWLLTPSSGQSGMYVMVTARGPVGRAERVAMTGRDGGRAEIEIKQVGEPRTETTGFSGQRNVMFTLHLHNTGEVWIGSRLDPGAWVRDQYGQSHEANQMLSVSSGPTGATDPNANRGWQLDPDWEVDRNVVFTVPENARLTRLHIVVPMGDATPTAEWNL